MLGVEAEWVGVSDGLPIFEGVRRADLGVLDGLEGSRDESDVAAGVRIFDIGSCGRAEVGGGAGCEEVAVVDILRGQGHSIFSVLKLGVVMMAYFVYIMNPCNNQTTICSLRIDSGAV